MQKIIVIYHSDCLDGFGAAYAAWKKFGQYGAEYIPAQYNRSPPDVTGAEVYILDFSYPREVLEEMNAKASSLLVLDHHESAEEALKGLPYAVFDMGRSGCVMAWEHFFPDTHAPKGLRYIQDRDLWRFDFEETKSFCAAIHSLVPREFQAWEAYLTPWYSERIKELTGRGRDLLKVFNADLDAIEKRAHLVDIAGTFFLACNATAKYASELGHRLAVKSITGKSAIYSYSGASGLWEFSLRSAVGISVIDTAKKFGGGGHAAACGFSVKELPWITNGS